MSDDERDEEELPPPATWAGKARKADEEGEDAEGNLGLTEEFDGIEAELSADLDNVGDDEEPASEEEDDGDEALDDAEPDEADEQEEPPDEFEFEEDEVEDESEEESSETIEANTLALADREAAKEAAHSGLKKRTEKSAVTRGITTGTHAVPPVAAKVAAATAPPEASGEPPKRRMWWRFAAASVVIVASVASATAVAFLLYLSDFAEGLNDEDLNDARAQLESVEGGRPSTILVLGSDIRGIEGSTDPGRSDTAILLRVDPEKGFLSLLSLPRDLEVPIPGYGVDKLNAAYSYGEQAKPGGGGTELAIKTISDYMDIPINHVVNVDFEGFYEAVNAIDCVYVDVDRYYFNPMGGEYAVIDVPAGYSKLCGYTALQYVRYRHNDNDLVRGARQQDFIREARQRIPPRELLPVIGKGGELIEIFKDNTSSDINNVPDVIEMLKTFVEVRDAPVRQVSVGAITPEGGVRATDEQVEVARNQFLGNDLEDAGDIPAEDAKQNDDAGSGAKKPEEKKPETPAAPAGLIDSTTTGQQYADKFDKFMEEKKAKLPIFYPTQIVSNATAAISEESRAAALAGPNNKDVYYMYKYVLPFQEASYLSYYGVSGVNWTDPPILKNPSEIREVDGREFMLFYERDKLRLVGWKTKRGSYWVINTLTRSLTEDQMLGIAANTREFGK